MGKFDKIVSNLNQYENELDMFAKEFEKMEKEMFEKLSTKDGQRIFRSM